MQKLPKYYLEAIQSWAEIQKYRNITNRQQILDENLFGNDKIQYRNRPIYFKNWAKSEITKIRHIWDNQNWKRTETILDKLDDKRNWIHEYTIVRQAIPNTWRETLKGKNQVNTKYKLDVNLNNLNPLIAGK